VTSNLNDKSILILLEKAINWLHQTAYFIEYNKILDEVVRKWLKIKNERQIDEEIQIEDNPIGWLCYDAYDNKQWIFHLEDERKVRLFEITGMKGTKVKKTLKIILKEYDDVIFQKVYNIENC